MIEVTEEGIMSNRAPSINKIMVAGNVVKDAEVHHIGDNLTSIMRFTLAHNQSFKDKDGKWQDNSTFIEVDLWGSSADKIAEKTKKGVPVMVEGALRQNRWDDKEGKTHTKLFIKAERVYFL
jgi:single-strand DNA-binding protein